MSAALLVFEFQWKSVGYLLPTIVCLWKGSYLFYIGSINIKKGFKYRKLKEATHKEYPKNFYGQGFQSFQLWRLEKLRNDSSFLLLGWSNAWTLSYMYSKNFFAHGINNLFSFASCRDKYLHLFTLYVYLYFTHD